MANGPITELPGTAVGEIASVFEVAKTNRALIDEKKAKLDATIDLVNKKIPEIKDVGQDEYIEKLVVIGRDGINQCEAWRKEFTGRVHEWLKDQIAPENALKLKVQTLVDKRNVWANALKAKADEANAKIQKQKDRDTHVIEVKGRMRLSIEKAMVEKVVNFEATIENAFKQITVANADKVAAQLKGLKPNLKEEFFLPLFHVDYDAERMTPDEFDDLVKRAKTYWVYETLNEKYKAETTAIITKWLEKIPQKVKELKTIAAGGEQGERVKKIVQERDAAEAKDSATAAAQQLKQIEASINDETQGEIITTEFKAQGETQKIVLPTGSREEVYFTVDNPNDFGAFAKILSSIVAHCIVNKSAEDRAKLIIQHDKDGNPKKDEHGQIVYTPGVQFWLDAAVSMDYSAKNIKGITRRTRLKTVAKKK
jgi:hypothetical protein